MLRVVLEVVTAFFAVWGWYSLLSDSKRPSRFFVWKDRTIYLVDVDDAEYLLQRAVHAAQKNGDAICIRIPSGDENLYEIAKRFAERYPFVVVEKIESD